MPLNWAGKPGWEAALGAAPGSCAVLESGNRGIIKAGKTSKSISPLTRVPKSHIHMVTPPQPVPIPNHPFHKELSPNFQPNSLLAQLKAAPLVPKARLC